MRLSTPRKQKCRFSVNVHGITCDTSPLETALFSLRYSKTQILQDQDDSHVEVRGVMENVR